MGGAPLGDSLPGKESRKIATVSCFLAGSPYKIHGAGSPYKKHDPYKLCGVCTFLTEVPHKMHGGHTKCIVATQNTRHFLLESFVWEEAIHVPFLNRGVSYD